VEQALKENPKLGAKASREAAKLSGGLENRLKAYIVAAGAAGVALAAPAVANADIIPISSSYNYANPSFSLLAPGLYLIGEGSGSSGWRRGGSYWWHYKGLSVNGYLFASAGIRPGLLGKGVPVEGGAFVPRLSLGTAFAYRLNICNSLSGSCRLYGGNAGGRAPGSGYIGLELPGDHFGWAHVDLQYRAGYNPLVASVWGTIVPIYEETIPGRQILTGQTTDIPEPATLSLLALGAAGLGLWRKKKAA